MNPTGWGWLTIVSALVVSLDIAWLRTILKQGKRSPIAVVGIAGGIFLFLLFLFSFMQWVSWYK